MKRALLLFCLGFAAPARADNLKGARFWWPHWKLVTSETLMGRDAQEASEYPHSLIAAYDGDAKTTWRYRPNISWQTGKPRHETPALEIAHNMTLDNVRLLAKTPLRRARLVFISGKTTSSRDFTFGSAAGWKTLHFPAKKITRLRIVFPGVRTLHMAEIELFKGNQKVNYQMPRAVMMMPAIPACVAPLLINRNGRVLDGIAADIGHEDKWSNDGRYVCGLSGDSTFWVYDAWRGVRVKKTSWNAEVFDSSYQWLDNRRVLLTGGEGKKARRRIIRVP